MVLCVIFPSVKSELDYIEILIHYILFLFHLLST